MSELFNFCDFSRDRCVNGGGHELGRIGHLLTFRNFVPYLHDRLRRHAQVLHHRQDNALGRGHLDKG